MMLVLGRVVGPFTVHVLRVRARVVGVLGVGSGSVVPVLGVVGSGRVGCSAERDGMGKLSEWW